MRYHALAADYDGTLAHHGLIDDLTWASLKQLRESGRKLIMVTGRELDELLALLPHPEMFDRIVAENGAVLYSPASKKVTLLAPPPPPEFGDELKKRGAERVAVGRVIVATWEPHQDTVLHVIHDMGLELQVIFNTGAVMILPTGVNKATGLEAALHDLGLSKHNVVAVGDAENDHALLTRAELGVAVANALPSLKQHADLVTPGDHGTGVSQVIDRLIANDLADISPPRHRIKVGQANGQHVTIDPYETNIMIAGTSGSGKSTLTTAILERLCERGYQYVILDPEGDYTSIESAVVLGAPHRAPLVDEVIDVLRDSSRNAVVNMLGIAVDHRPEFFAKLLPALAELRMRTGRPHWLVVDEAHHLLPSSWQPVAELALRPHGTLYVTVHPGSVAQPVIDTINTVFVVGDHPDKTVKEFWNVARIKKPPHVASEKLGPGHALYWETKTNLAAVIETEPSTTERTRHSRKYVEGNLGSHSFVFRGPDKKLNLKASNLMLFLLLAEGVDDDTWLHHLRNGEYSQWFRTNVKDPDLAQAAEAAEKDASISAQASRELIRAEIEKRYTLPADEPSGVIDD
ncbi:MAG TPA: HAD-IIB family hydrolase [Kofleriaceae bacterium]|nr:HAD-IIB family hydrolase [Kofleriaceae bacterium]